MIKTNEQADEERREEVLDESNSVPCAACAKPHPPTEIHYHVSNTEVLTVLLLINGRKLHVDFCNEDCLREYLVKRHAAKTAPPIEKALLD